MKLMEKMGFRHYVHYAIAVIAMHACTWFCRVIVLSGIFAQSVESEDGMARVIIIFFSLLTNVLFCVFHTRVLLQDGERRRTYLQLSKERTVSFGEQWHWMWKRSLIHVAMFAVFQLPFLVFYSSFGMVYVNGTILDSFYALEAGFYELFYNGVLGFFLHIAFLFAGHILGEWIVYRIWDKENQP